MGAGLVARGFRMKRIVRGYSDNVGGHCEMYNIKCALSVMSLVIHLILLAVKAFSTFINRDFYETLKH